MLCESQCVGVESLQNDCYRPSGKALDGTDRYPVLCKRVNLRFRSILEEDAHLSSFQSLRRCSQATHFERNLCWRWCQLWPPKKSRERPRVNVWKRNEKWITTDFLVLKSGNCVSLFAVQWSFQALAVHIRWIAVTDRLATAPITSIRLLWKRAIGDLHS